MKFTPRHNVSEGACRSGTFAGWDMNRQSSQGHGAGGLGSLSPCFHAAKSLQPCLTLCDLIDGSPPGSAVPGILQARTLKWVAISFSNAWKWKVKVKSLSRVWLFATPWTAAHQAPPSMGFSRQEYWSGVPLPSPKERSVNSSGLISFRFDGESGRNSGTVCLNNGWESLENKNAFHRRPESRAAAERADRRAHLEGMETLDRGAGNSI